MACIFLPCGTVGTCTNTFVRLVYIGFFLFSVLLSVVTIIGSVLGFMYTDSVRRVGITLLIITDVILLVSSYLTL